ncbi:MAG: glycosyltransferase [archaeon]
MSDKPEISVVIPALNEEEYLPKLLSDLKKQVDAPQFEIIVADGGSKDRTRELARKAGARIVRGGNSPAIARNGGARFARGELVFFLDADVRVPQKFVARVYSEMERRYLDLATCHFYSTSNLEIDSLMHRFANFYLHLNRTIDPHLPGFCIFCSRRLFERVGGFDEKLRLSEDHDFAKRASIFRPIEFVESTSVRVSIRRLRKEGRVGLSVKYLRAEIYRILGIKGKRIEYVFGEFRKKYHGDAGSFSMLADKNLLRLEHFYRRISKKK